MSNENRYTNNGFKDREDYLKSLCDEFPSDWVEMCSDMLGEEEDFDGLVSHLEDFEDMYQDMFLKIKIK